MLTQIFIGSFAIILTIIIQVVFINVAVYVVTRLGSWLIKPIFIIKTIISTSTVVIWVVAGISLCIWLWAGLFLLLGVFECLEPAMYFTLVTFTTLGYGDITVDQSWRILAGFVAVDGLLIFGLNTAFLVEFSNRVRVAQENTITSNDK